MGRSRVYQLLITRFVEKLSCETLMQVMQYCNWSKSIHTVESLQINVAFHSEGYIHVSTCTFSLLMLNCLASYGCFDAAFDGSIYSSGKSFTTVWTLLLFTHKNKYLILRMLSTNIVVENVVFLNTLLLGFS